MSEFFDSLCTAFTRDCLRFLCSPFCGAEDREFPGSYEELVKFLEEHGIGLHEALKPWAHSAILTTDERNRLPAEYHGRGLLLLRARRG